MFFWIRFILIALIVGGVIGIVVLTTKIKPIPKSKGKKYEEAKKYDLKLLGIGAACFFVVILFGNLYAKTFPSKEQYKELKEYVQVDRYSYQEGTVVYEHSGNNLYMKDGVLYEVNVTIGGGETLIFEEIYLPTDKNPCIYVAE